jgi:hypothetical protein
MIIYAVRTKEQKAETFDNVGGVLKHWARTGNIDFHVVAPESSAPGGGTEDRRKFDW